MFWDNESGGSAIPEVCRIQCEGIWEMVTQEKPEDTEMFVPDCNHFVEFGGTSLYRVIGAMRRVGILQLCMSDDIHDEAFSESWSFMCPFEELNENPYSDTRTMKGLVHDTEMRVKYCTCRSTGIMY